MTKDRILRSPYADRQEVEALTGCKKTKALQIIRKLNAELEKTGKSQSVARFRANTYTND